MNIGLNMPAEPIDPDRAILKAELRNRMRTALLKIAGARRQQDSLRACELLARQRVWCNATAILFFVARPDELDLLPLLEAALAARKAVALPRYVPETGAYTACRIEQYPRDCAPGKFGIAEPSAACPIFPLNRLDFALVPGLAYDLSGHRLGRGQGYYDRLLAEVTGTRCGVAFDEQIIEPIPAEPHDMSVNCILTPTQWMEFPAAG
jgi:5-formyltetrahydrofolate cyclo-ligase